MEKVILTLTKDVRFTKSMNYKNVWIVRAYKKSKKINDFEYSLKKHAESSIRRLKRVFSNKGYSVSIKK